MAEINAQKVTEVIEDTAGASLDPAAAIQ